MTSGKRDLCLLFSIPLCNLIYCQKEPGGEIEEKTGKLEQLKSVLEM